MESEMPLSNKIWDYSLIAKILQQLEDKGGGTVECDSAGRAISWRQRAYKYRQLLTRTGNDALEGLHLKLDGTKVIVEFYSKPRIIDDPAKPEEPEWMKDPETRKLMEETALRLKTESNE